jgi:hypothetical protein
MLKQQIIGIINLSTPVIILYQFCPSIFLVWYGQIVCALLVALYLLYLNRVAVQQNSAALLYTPTAHYKESLENMIRGCGLQPEEVQIRYAFTNESIAQNMENMVIIDPTLFSEYENDPGANAVLTLFSTTFVRGLTPNGEMRIPAIKEILSSAAQHFIFKHELGHIYYNYTAKKLVVIGMIGFCAAYLAIVAAIKTVPVNGFLAILVGMTVGCVVDLALSYWSNIVFKLSQEKAADQFAVAHSTREDIEAAADFFRKHQEILDTYPEEGFFANLPSVIKTGHQNGYDRAQTLRTLIKK